MYAYIKSLIKICSDKISVTYKMIQAIHLFSVIIIVIISYFISILIEPLLPVIYFICRWLVILKLTEWIHSLIIDYTRQLWKSPNPAEETDNTPVETIFLRQLMELYQKDQQRQQSRVQRLTSNFH